MKFGSVCSGIEAASCAWEPLGWKAQFVSEIEPFPCSVLAHHYPTVPNLGDMTKFKEWENHEIDVLVGGTPCQSFSVAGLRKGLDDPRGNLMLTYLAIADQYRPKWLVWENVPGVLSSNDGKDFGAFLGGLAELGYGFAYRVLDAQHFGVPQRRRRVFVVGCLGDWRSAAAVLFERHSLQGHPAPRRQAGKIPAAGTLRSTDGGIDIDHAAAGHLIAHTLRGEGFDASEDGTGRGTPLVPVAFNLRGREGGAQLEIDPTGMANIRAASGGSSRTMVATASREIAGTLTSNYGKQPDSSDSSLGPNLAIAFDCKASGQSGFGIGEIASTMRAMGHANSHSNGGGHQAVAIGADCFNGALTGEVVATMGTRGSSETASGPTLMAGMQVRRLTPRECERLQGFPDDYTLVPHRGKPAADGPRYKALGNSMAVPVMAWIGARIDQVDVITTQMEIAA